MGMEILHATSGTFAHGIFFGTENVVHSHDYMAIQKRRVYEAVKLLFPESKDLSREGLLKFMKRNKLSVQDKREMTDDRGVINVYWFLVRNL